MFVLPDEHTDEVFPHNIVVFGDVGVNATMTPEMLAQVAVGTCAVARDLVPEEVLPEIHGVIVSYSNRGSDEGPSPELVRQATALVPEVLAERVRRRPALRHHPHPRRGEGLGGAVAALAPPTTGRAPTRPGRAAPTSSSAPTSRRGTCSTTSTPRASPRAKKFPVLFGVRFRGVDLAMDSTPEDIRLAVKASVLRMHRYGEWKRTPRDTFFRRRRVLAVNPGSTSTKIGVYEGEEERFTVEIQHSAEELKPFEGQEHHGAVRLPQGASSRRRWPSHGLTVADLDAVSARGGLLHPVPHGTMAVSEDMLEDLRSGRYGEHASNLGALIARELDRRTGPPGLHRGPGGGGRGAGAGQGHRHEDGAPPGHQPRPEPDRHRPPLRRGARDLLREGERRRLPPGRRHQRRRPQARPLHRRQQRASTARARSRRSARARCPSGS